MRDGDGSADQHADADSFGELFGGHAGFVAFD